MHLNSTGKLGPKFRLRQAFCEARTHAVELGTQSRKRACVGYAKRAGYRFSCDSCEGAGRPGCWVHQTRNAPVGVLA